MSALEPTVRWQGHEGQLWVEPSRSMPGSRMAGIGASRPLRRIPAIVFFLNPQPALSLVGANRSSCTNTDIRKERGVCAGGAAQVRTVGNHGLENAGSLCHGETEIIGGVA
jgi:hypothetical protein